MDDFSMSGEYFFPIIIFDFINFIFNYPLRLEFFCLYISANSVVETNIFNTPFKGWGSLERCFLWSISFDGNLFVGSFSNFVSSERCSVYDFRSTSSFTILFNYSCYFPLNPSIIHIFLKYLVISIFILIIPSKHVLDCVLKVIFWHKWQCCDNSGIFISNDFWWKLACYLLQLFMLFLKYLIRSSKHSFKYLTIFTKLVLEFGVKITFWHKC